MESSATHTHTGDPNSAKNKLLTFIFQSILYQTIHNARGWKLVMLHLATRPSLCQKTTRSLKHSFQSCTSMPGFSQVQSEPSWKLDQCNKQSHLDLSILFQAQFKQFYQILDHVKYELLNQDEMQHVKYQEATLAWIRQQSISTRPNMLVAKTGWPCFRIFKSK